MSNQPLSWSTVFEVNSLAISFFSWKNNFIPCPIIWRSMVVSNPLKFEAFQSSTGFSHANMQFAQISKDFFLTFAVAHMGISLAITSLISFLHFANCYTPCYITFCLAYHFWDTANMNLNMNLNRNVNFRNDICLIPWI